MFVAQSAGGCLRFDCGIWKWRRAPRFLRRTDLRRKYSGRNYLSGSLAGRLPIGSRYRGIARIGKSTFYVERAAIFGGVTTVDATAIMEG